MQGIVLKGTIKEVLQQLNGLIAYYGRNAKLSEVIENENKISDKIIIEQCFDGLYGV